jgi:prepilin signal peptidase PulO-like enzyme (type II secretory pathway)
MFALRQSSKKAPDLTTKNLIALHLAVYGAFACLWPPVTPVWGLVIAALLIWISVEDFRSYEIPDLGWALLLFAGLLYSSGSGVSFWQLALDALAWPVVVWTIVLVHARLRGRQGFGFGDVKLLSGIGVWVGFQGVTSTLLAAALSGILAILVVAMLRRQPIAEAAANIIAFGPFLCLSCWAVMLQEGRV